MINEEDNILQKISRESLRPYYESEFSNHLSSNELKRILEKLAKEGLLTINRDRSITVTDDGVKVSKIGYLKWKEQLQNQNNRDRFWGYLGGAGSFISSIVSIIALCFSYYVYISQKNDNVSIEKLKLKIDSLENKINKVNILKP